MIENNFSILLFVSIVKGETHITYNVQSKNTLLRQEDMHDNHLIIIMKKGQISITY